MKKKQTLFAIIGGIVLVALVGVVVYFSNYNKLDHVALPQLTTAVASDEAEVELVTTDGNIKMKLFPKLAPKAVENFLTLSKEGYYKNNEFFRVLDNFMIQTGSKDNKASGESKSIFGAPFANEISDQLYNIRGAVSLANAGQGTTSNGSQFFIVQNPKDMSSQIDTSSYPSKIAAAYKHGGYPSLDGQYTVFGQVISGMNVVDKIAAGKVSAATDSSGGSAGTPVSPVKITEVKILKDWKFSN